MVSEDPASRGGGGGGGGGVFRSASSSPPPPPGEAAALCCSKLLEHTKGLVAWSPDGQSIASTANNRLIIRDARTLQVVARHSCIDTIESTIALPWWYLHITIEQNIEWGSDSNLILCAMYKRGAIQAMQVDDPEWTCRITEGVAGIMAAQWCPDARHIITTADFHLSLTIWPLDKPGQNFVIKKPKATGPLAFFFHHHQQQQHQQAGAWLMALVTRDHCKDHLSLYQVGHRWQLLRTFQLDTLDCVAVAWSPEGGAVAVQDTCLVYGLQVVCPADGSTLMKYQAYGEALGIRTMAWSPSGRMLVVGSYDHCVRVISSVTWSVVCELKHVPPRSLPPSLRSRDMACFIEEEAEGYVSKLPHSLPVVRSDPTKPNPKMGVCQVSWSADGRYLMSRDEGMPTAVWVWDMEALGLVCLLVQAHPVKSARWSSQGHQLALATGKGCLYLWCPSGASWLDLPATLAMDIKSVRWAPSQGHPSLLLLTSTHFCTGTLPSE